MSALFDASSVDPGRPAMPEGWDLYEATCDVPMGIHEGPPDLTIDEIEDWFANLVSADQGQPTALGVPDPADHARLGDAIFHVTARIAESSQENADAELEARIRAAIKRWEGRP